MKQGEIWFANLNPGKGSEQAGMRPVVILSGNVLNQHMPIVIVAPLTSQVKRYKGNPVLKPGKSNGLKKESEMLIFQIRSISKRCVMEKIGDIDSNEFQLAIKTLNDILKY